ncbi:MAG: NADH-quinone oxidoreductase subunit NuoN [Rhodospirillales bacterium]|nr:NADH-quinone oxidoreductase subunit NuoN [Rhodospirillales bacterium]
MPTAEFPNLFPALPEIFLLVAAMALLMFGVFRKDDEAGPARVRCSRIVARLCILALLCALILVVTMNGSDRVTTFNGMFVVDRFAVYFKVLILISSALSILIAQDYLEVHRVARFEFPVLVVLASVGMMLMVSANDLMALYLGLEMQSLSLYIIASFQRDDQRSVEAGLKYFVLSALASGMLLYGSSLIYGFTGTTSFDAMAGALAAAPGEAVSLGALIGIVFILAGLAFKISAVPFHMWTPDVYEGAPTPVTAFFAVAPKLAAIALLLRVMMEPFGALTVQWQQVIVFISVASMALGAYAAIGQSNIKRLMAYSSIGHVGYALIGLAVGNEAGVRGVLIYMAIYLFMNIGAFTCILSMRRRGQMVVGINDLAGVSKSNPMLALALAIFMFSLAGIPPLAGFFGKLYIFLAAVQAGYFTLAIIGVLTSVVGAFYYIRIVKVMYFDEAEEVLDRRMDRPTALVMAATGILIAIFFIIPDPLLSQAQAAAQSLFGG